MSSSAIFLWAALAKFVWVVVTALTSLTFLVSEIPLKYYINFSYTLLLPIVDWILLDLSCVDISRKYVLIKMIWFYKLL